MPKPPSPIAGCGTEPPASVVSMDTSVPDVFLVGGDRPVITVEIDECSRAILGWRIDPAGKPSASPV